MFRLPLYLQIWQQSLDECLNTLDKTMLLTSFLYFHFCITTFWLDIHEPPVDNSRPQRGNGTSCYFAAEEGRKPVAQCMAATWCTKIQTVTSWTSAGVLDLLHHVQTLVLPDQATKSPASKIYT